MRLGKLGFSTVGFVFVELARQALAAVRQFEEGVRACPNVRECSALSGEADFLLKCVSQDARSLEDFVQGTIAQMPGVESVKTAIVLRGSQKHADMLRRP